MSLKILLFTCLGPMLFQMIGPWNGIRPRPMLMMPSDVVPGLIMTFVLTACCESSRMFSAAKNHNFNSNVFSKFETLHYCWKLL
jgi:hypothetical protein